MSTGWLQRGALVLGSLAFAGVLVEVAFRVVGAQQGIDYRLYLKELKNSDRLPRGLFRRDPNYKTGLVPNQQKLAVTSDYTVVYATNSKGLRDREYDYERSPGKLRVLALGDSITFGEGVAYGERYTDIPEASLDGLEIINASVPGWGLETELVYLVREGLRYDPDWVVVFLNWVDLKRQLPGLVRDGRVEIPDRPALPARDDDPSAGAGEGTWYLKADDPFFREQSWIVRSSYALSYLSFRLALLRQRDSLAEQDEARWTSKNPDRETPDEVADIPGAPERVHLVLRKYTELAEKEGFRLMIVNISSWATFSFIPGQYPDIVYHDLAPLLVEEAQRASISFQYDPHFNPRTHALLGKKLTEILRPLVEEHRARESSGS